MAGATSQYVHKGKRGTWTGGGGKSVFPTDYGVMGKIINLPEPQYKMRPGSACEVKVLKNVTITAHFYHASYEPGTTSPRLILTCACEVSIVSPVL